MRRISFTGSPETARAIGVAAAGNIVPFTGELGGKGPLIVFADGDLEAAARKAAGQYDDSGQVCLAGTRLLVEESVARARSSSGSSASRDAHVLGDPRDDATTMSPLIHPDHLARVEGFVERARARPATRSCAAGGAGRDAAGCWYEPTLVEPRSNDSEIVQREVFGPVLTFQTFARRGRGDRARQLDPVRPRRRSSTPAARSAPSASGARCGPARSGSTRSSMRDLTAPFGGIGISGIGREGGDYALDFYSRPEDAADPRRHDAAAGEGEVRGSLARTCKASVEDRRADSRRAGGALRRGKGDAVADRGGARNPRLETLHELADALGVSPTELLAPADEPQVRIVRSGGGST